MTRHPIKITFLLIAMLATVSIAVSQSGRRLPNSKNAAPAPSPEPEASPSPTPRPEAPPAYTMIVGGEPDMAFDNVATFYVGAAVESCAQRLDKSPSVAVQSSSHNMSRAKAIKAAKGSPEAHVVWLQVRTEDIGVKAANDGSSIFIEYYVFAPETAKIVASGRTSQGTGNRSIIGQIPTARNSAAYREAMIREAAEITAERILSSLDLPLQGRPIPPFTHN